MVSWIVSVDWHTLVVPTHSLAEMVVRGTLVYLVLLALLRFILKRQAGGLGITDVLVVVLIADAAQNAMANEYKSVPEGIVLVATILFWNFALDWLGYRVPWIQRLVHPPPLLLIEDGRLQRRNMRRELITLDELMAQLRENGVENPADVRRAHMEGDGTISVIKKEA